MGAPDFTISECEILCQLGFSIPSREDESNCTEDTFNENYGWAEYSFGSGDTLVITREPEGFELDLFVDVFINKPSNKHKKRFRSFEELIKYLEG